MSKPSAPMSASKKRKAGPGGGGGTTLDDLTALTTAQLYSLSCRRHRDESLGNVRRAQEERDRAYLSLVSSSDSCAVALFAPTADLFGWEVSPRSSLTFTPHIHIAFCRNRARDGSKGQANTSSGWKRMPRRPTRNTRMPRDFSLASVWL